MKWDELAQEPCSVARSLAVIGDRWTLMILRDAFLGVRRFEAFQARLGISRSIVTERLTLLVAEGVLERRPYQDRPVRHEYRLTAKGLEQLDILDHVDPLTLGLIALVVAGTVGTLGWRLVRKRAKRRIPILDAPGV